MENKFVSSKELEEAKLKRQEEWKKAFERIGEKPPPIEEEYDPRTLYERLQEQKIKKEEAFQEMTKLSNLIHRLDEDEIEFLAALESEERVKELEKMKRDEEELEKFRRAAAEADKAAISKPTIHSNNEPISSSVKVNTLKHDSQRMILANAVKKTTAKSINKRSSIKQPPSPIVKQEPLSPDIDEPTSITTKRELRDDQGEENSSKRIKIEGPNVSLSQKQKGIDKNSNEKQLNFSFIEKTKSVSHNGKIVFEKDTNPLSSLLVYSDNSSDDDTS